MGVNCPPVVVLYVWLVGVFEEPAPREDKGFPTTTCNPILVLDCRRTEDKTASGFAVVYFVFGAVLTRPVCCAQAPFFEHTRVAVLSDGPGGV